MHDPQENTFLPNLCDIQQLFILSVGAQLIAFILILANGDILGESWDELGLLSVFVQWITLTSTGGLCFARRWLSTLGPFWASIMAYLIIMGTTAIIASIAQYLLIQANYQWGSIPEVTGQFVTRCLMIATIVSIVTLRYLYIYQQWRRRIELETQARVDALQARIRPHFLFNSMNIIASLIHSDPDMAERVVEDLSDLFRATLQETRSMIPFSQEWRLCTHYLHIEALRLGTRLTTHIDITAIPEDATLPLLSLQPLLENAIHHGIQPLEKGGAITILGTMHNNVITLVLSNPVSNHSAPPPGPKGNKMALKNIRHRLDLIFGSAGKLDVNISPDTYEVYITFPYLKGKL